MPLRYACLLVPLAFLPCSPSPGVGPAASPPTRTDRQGDPLPLFALARLGTVRLRHGHNVQAVAFAPAGKTFASAGWDHSVRLWDVNTGKELRTFGEPRDAGNPYAYSRWLSCVAFSPDGKLLASGEYAKAWPSNTVYIWEAATGKQRFKLGANGGGAICVAFAPDGKVLASGCRDQTLRLWNLTGRPGALLRGHQAAIHAVAFAPNGKTLASADAAGVVCLWDPATLKLIRQMSAHPGGAMAAVFASDGKRLATAGNDGTVCLWDPATGKELRRFDAHKGGVRAVAFAPDGKTLASAGKDKAVRLWDAATGKALGRLDGHHAEVTAVAFSPDGKTLASTAVDQTVRLWDTATQKERRPRPGHQSVVCTVRFLKGGKTLVSTGRDRSVRWWDWRAGTESRAAATASPPLDRTGVASTPGGELLALTTPQGPIRLLDTASGTEVGKLRGHGPGPVCLAFSVDGKTLASAGADKTVRVWDVARKRERHCFPIEQVPTGALFAPDGKLLLWGKDQTAHLWDVKTGSAARAIPIPSYIVRSFAFSPDGQFLARGDHNGHVHVLNLLTGKELPPLAGLAGYVHTLAFSPDGRSLAAGGWGAAVVWEVPTWGVRCRFTNICGDVLGLAFTPDSRCLASAGGDTTILVWDLSAGELTHGPRPKLSEGELQFRWEDLTQATGPGTRASWVLVARPAQAVPYLRERLKPIVATWGQRLTRLVRELDDKRFAVRAKAVQELERLGELALPAVRKALAGQPTLEARRRLEKLLEHALSRPPSPERLRAARAIEVLEQIATPEALKLLRSLAKGAPEAQLTQDAKAAVERLTARGPGAP